MTALTEGAGELLEPPQGAGPQPINTKPLFRLMVERRASDLFFSPNAPIKIKIEGQIFPVNKQILTVDMVRQAAFGLMNPDQIERFGREQEIDFAISESGLGRFRVNVFRQRGNPAMVLRHVAGRIPKLADLSLPEPVQDLMTLKRGLVLVVGATGSGKSTTGTRISRSTSSRSRIRSSSCTPTSAPSSTSARSASTRAPTRTPCARWCVPHPTWS